MIPGGLVPPLLGTSSMVRHFRGSSTNAALDAAVFRSRVSISAGGAHTWAGN